MHVEDRNSLKIQYFDLVLLDTIRVKSNSLSNSLIIPVFNGYPHEHSFQFTAKRAIQIWLNSIIFDTLTLYLRFVYLHMVLCIISYIYIYIYILASQ